MAVGIDAQVTGPPPLHSVGLKNIVDIEYCSALPCVPNREVVHICYIVLETMYHPPQVVDNLPVLLWRHRTLQQTPKGVDKLSTRYA